MKGFLQVVNLILFSEKKCIVTHFMFSVCFILIVYSCASGPSRENLDSAESHHRLGVSYLENGQVNKAFMEFQKAIELNPGKKGTLNYLGYLSMRLKKYDEAISYYKKAISIDPDYSKALNNLGITYAEMGNWDESVKYFDSALSNPMYETPEMAFTNKGYVLYMKGDYDQAERAVKEALIINRLIPKAFYVLGLVYTKLDNDDAAIEEFIKAIGLVPDYIEAHMDLAKTYLRSGNKAKALKHFEAVLEYDNNPLRLREASDHISRLKY